MTHILSQAISHIQSGTIIGYHNKGGLVYRKSCSWLLTIEYHSCWLCCNFQYIVSEVGLRMWLITCASLWLCILEYIAKSCGDWKNHSSVQAFLPGTSIWLTWIGVFIIPSWIEFSLEPRYSMQVTQMFYIGH